MFSNIVAVLFKLLIKKVLKMQKFFVLLILYQVFAVTNGCAPKFANQNPRCGKPTAQGTQLSQGAWPWAVDLYKVKSNKENFICGGSFILDRHVLTGKFLKRFKLKKTELNVVELILFTTFRRSLHS